MSEIIMESTDYDMFEMLSFNRSVKKTVKLEESMRRYGFISAYPLHVVKNGKGKFRIKAGHHRFLVSRKLGIPVKYVICDDKISIYELEESTRQWSMQDYMESYIKSGHKDYLDVKNYCDRTGIGIQSAISMLGGQSAASGNYGTQFKHGTYQTKRDKSHALIVEDIIGHMVTIGIQWATIDPVVRAVSKIVWAEGFNSSLMKKKLTVHKYLIQKQASMNDYVKLFDTIYNFASRNPIPLAFNADKAARERNVCIKEARG